MVILLLFTYQVMLANPNWKNIFLSALPTPELVAQHPVVNGLSPLTGSLGIIGATVIPIIFICIHLFAKLEKLTMMI